MFSFQNITKIAKCDISTTATIFNDVVNNFLATEQVSFEQMFHANNKNSLNQYLPE